MLEGFYYYRLLLESALVGAVRRRHMFPGTCSGWGAAGLSSEMESRSAMVARMFHEGDTMCVRWCGGVVLRKWSPARLGSSEREGGSGARSSRPAIAIDSPDGGAGGAGGQAPA